MKRKKNTLTDFFGTDYRVKKMGGKKISKSMNEFGLTLV
jgi:hypothetical protein